MAQAVLAENPERVRRKLNSLGVSRVGRAEIRDLRHETRDTGEGAQLAGLRFSRIFFFTREIPAAFWVDVRAGVAYLLTCRREGKLERGHPARKGRPGARKGDGIVRPGAPRKGRRRLRKGPSEAAFGPGPVGRTPRRTASAGW